MVLSTLDAVSVPAKAHALHEVRNHSVLKRVTCCSHTQSTCLLCRVRFICAAIVACTPQGTDCFNRDAFLST